MVKEYKITLSWDDEASVWIATSDDIQGLVLESESFDELLGEVRLAAQELLSFSNEFDGNIYLNLAATRHERLLRNA